MDLSENVDNSSCDEENFLIDDIWDIVLRMLESCKQRNHARFVCKLWRDLLNRNCSGEKMLIPREAPSNPKKWSVLMKSQRRYIHYEFVQTVETIDKFDEFFTQRGDFITSLDISACDLSASKMKMILSNCRHLRMLIIHWIDHDWLNQLCEDGLRHHSLTNLTWWRMEPRNIFNGFRHIRCVLPNLKSLNLKKLGEFPDGNHLRTLQNMRYNMVIIGHDFDRNHFRIDEDNNIHVNIECAKFNFDSSAADTSITEYKRPYGQTERSLLEFMTLRKNLKHLKIDFGSWNLPTLTFPPIDYNITESNLRKVEFYGKKTVVLRHCPVLFNNLEKLCLYSCKVENFSPEIIAQMTNMKYLFIDVISYAAFVAVCEHMRKMKKLWVYRCSDFDENLRQIDRQKNLVKLKKLNFVRVPDEILKTEKRHPKVKRAGQFFSTYYHAGMFV